MNFMMRMTRLDVVYGYMCIHHTKRQTENTLISYSILTLKTLFNFVSQCNLEPFLESEFCNVGNELDNCDFAVVYPSSRSFLECN